MHNERSKSNEFTTTWSYSTSDDPLYAGFMSDVFVVPNLNVFYEIVYIVSWNNDGCEPALRDGNWPTRVLFDVDAESSQNSLGFYSRFQLLDQKIPEIQSTFDDLTFRIGKMDAGEKVCCCVKEEEDGLCPTDNNGDSQETCSCKPEDIQKFREKLKVMQDGLDGWKKATAIEKTQRDNKMNIIDWFTTVGGKGMNTESQLELNEQGEEQSSSLLPPNLVDDAVRLNNNFGRRRQQALNAIQENVFITNNGNIAGKEHVEELFEAETMRRRMDNSKDKLRNTKRIQFDGGAGTYEMVMSKEKVEEWSSLSCWLGCNVQSELSIE